MSADEKTEQHDVEGSPDLEPSDGVEIDKTATDDEAESEGDTTERDLTSWIGGKVARRRHVNVGPLALVLLLLVSGGLAAWLYVRWVLALPDRRPAAHDLDHVL